MKTKQSGALVVTGDRLNMANAAKPAQSGASVVTREGLNMTNAAKKLPIGLSSLSEIIENDYLYIDKTRFVYELAQQKYFFLSRPRRFGKTLLLDTIAQAFSGKKELFNGLYLEYNWDWGKNYPVINLSLTDSNCNTPEALDITLESLLSDSAAKYNITLDKQSHGSRFGELITKLYQKTGNQVVVLVDEYDKPILDAIDDTVLAIKNREMLKGFYGALKKYDQQLRFVLVTGVTKFAKAGIFSQLNNLNDISLHEGYADICGYTQRDIENTIKPYLKNVDLAKLKYWYNGYNFMGSETQKVYNPFDILLFIDNGNIYKNYWFETGTPSFLIKLLQKNCYYIPRLENLRLTDSALGSFDIENLSVEVLLLQAGYLTITQATQDCMMGIMLYTLDYPNFEVKQSLADRILADMFGGNNYTVAYHLQMREALNNNDMDAVIEVLRSFLATIPHNWYRNNEIQHYEGYYCSVVYTFFNAMGLHVIPEDNTNLGQIDLTLDLADKILILEFKLLKNGDAASALKQIKDKNYADKYRSSKKSIHLVGISFDNKSRNIHDFIVEQL